MADATAKRLMAQRDRDLRERVHPDRPERIVSGAAYEDDARLDASVRPKTLAEYIGQKRVKENIAIALEAARNRGEALDHVLLYGPPGLGKTTLAQIIAHELNVPIKISAGPLLERKGDLTAILTSLEAHEVFFLDEIHRLQAAVEEVLYPAMEDFRVDLVVGQGPGTRIHPYHLNHFTLVGATTRRTHHRTPSFPFWHRAPPRFLRTRRPAHHSPPLRQNPQHPDGRRRRRRDRPPLPRHATHRQPPPAPRPRLRRSPRRWQNHPLCRPGSSSHARRGRQWPR